MPVFEITTIDVFKSRYVVRASCIEDAQDMVLRDSPDELYQVRVSEEIIDSRQISKKDFNKLLDKVVKESYEEGGVNNAHMGEKIIFEGND